MIKKRIATLLTLLIVSLLATQSSWADIHGSSLGRGVSNATTPLLIAGELVLLSDKTAGKAQAVQGAKVLLVTTAITHALKFATREKRPTNNELDSFPSGHTAAAFAVATVVSDYHPKCKYLAYGAATAIGWSRVNIGAHYWKDVVSGAALGYFTAKHYTKQNLSVSPSGVGVNWKF